MAHDAQGQATGPQKLVIRNIGLLLSGAIENPILDADTIVAENGRIIAIGRSKDVDQDHATLVIDANGTAVTPGLIDSHVHPVAGDWTPRQNQMGWIDSNLNGGVTTMISAGEVHTPGRPRDVVGLKALAISAQRQFANFRPSGVKVHAGAPCIEPEMVEQDFKDLADAGVTLLGEVGLGGVKDGPTARRMVAWARKYGIQSTIHTGGPSIPGSGLIDKDVVLDADTDVVGHINGGHTALPDSQIRCICEGCKRGLEIVHNGNERAALYTLRLAKEMNELSPRHPRHRCAGGLGRPAARHRAHGVDAVIARRSSGRTGHLPRHRQHGAHAEARLRPHRSGPRGGFRVHGQGTAFGGRQPAAFDPARRSSRHRHGGDRRPDQMPAQPQHAARHTHSHHSSKVEDHGSANTQTASHPTRPKFLDFFPAGAALTKLATGFIWAEGPVWFSELNELRFSDIPNNRMMRWSPVNGLSTFRQPSQRTNGHTRDRDGNMISCEHGGRCVSRTYLDGRYEMIVSHWNGKRLNSPNDVVVKSDGTIWFTDPPYGIISEP